MKEGLGKIPEKDIESGNIRSYLAPEDYKPLQNVSNHFIYSFSGNSAFRHTPGIRRAYAETQLYLTKPRCHTFSNKIFLLLQLKEIRQENINAIRNALENPSTDIQELVQELEAKYTSKSAYIL